MQGDSEGLACYTSKSYKISIYLIITIVKNSQIQFAYQIVDSVSQYHHWANHPEEISTF